MTAYYPTEVVPATAEYVLDLLREADRDWEADDPLTFDTPVREFAWRWNDTILRWRELAPVLNDFTGLNLPIHEWEPVLSPMSERTLRDVCEFAVTRGATQPVIRPWPHVGGDCLPAGAFLAVRSLLACEGADPSAITPGTELGPYLLTYRERPWLETLTRLAPGRLPAPEFDFGRIAGERLVVAAFVCLVLVAVTGWAVPVLGGACLILGCCLLPIAYILAMTSGIQGPRQAELSGLRTFRDLAYRLAGQEPRRRIQPSP